MIEPLLDRWGELAPALEDVAASLERDSSRGEPLDPNALAAPLPRAYQWADGSAYVHHVELVRKARGAASAATARRAARSSSAASNSATRSLRC